MLKLLPFIFCNIPTLSKTPHLSSSFIIFHFLLFVLHFSFSPPTVNCFNFLINIFLLSPPSSSFPHTSFLLSFPTPKYSNISSSFNLLYILLLQHPSLFSHSFPLCIIPHSFFLALCPLPHFLSHYPSFPPSGIVLMSPSYSTFLTSLPFSSFSFSPNIPHILSLSSLSVYILILILIPRSSRLYPPDPLISSSSSQHPPSFSLASSSSILHAIPLPALLFIILIFPLL